MAVARKKISEDVPKEGFFFDDNNHLYFLDGKPLHGVTSVLGVIAKPALIQWAANEAIKFVRENASYKRQKLLRKGYVVIKDKFLEQARYAHAQKRDTAAEQGTDVHAEVERYVKDCVELYEGKPFVAYAEGSAIAPFVDWARKEDVRFISSEHKLYSKELWVAGTCDLVFEKGGKQYVGDVKTYAKIWDRTPFFQCAGYGVMWKEMQGAPIDGYCVLRLSKDGSFEDMWSFDVEGDTQAFLSALTLYKALKSFKK